MGGGLFGAVYRGLGQLAHGPISVAAVLVSEDIGAVDEYKHDRGAHKRADLDGDPDKERRALDPMPVAG